MRLVSRDPCAWNDAGDGQEDHYSDRRTLNIPHGASLVLMFPSRGCKQGVPASGSTNIMMEPAKR